MPCTSQRKENKQTLLFRGSPHGDQTSESKCRRHQSRKAGKNSKSWYLHKGQKNLSWNVNWSELGTWTGCLCVAGLRPHKQVMQATNSLSTMGPSMTKDILLRMHSANKSQAKPATKDSNQTRSTIQCNSKQHCWEWEGTHLKKSRTNQ